MSNNGNYYVEIQKLVEKIKELKIWLHETDDSETKQYLKLAIKKCYIDINTILEKHRTL